RITYDEDIEFIRVLHGHHPLDRTPIHPESYKHKEKLLDMIGLTLNDIGTDDLKQELKQVDLKEATEKLDIGEPTLIDIIEALSRPGRDPPEDFPQPVLEQNI